VTSLARPGGNTTGVNFLVFVGDGKRQDILIEAVPGLRLMAVLTDINYTKYRNLDALQEAARARGIEFQFIVSREVKRSQQLSIVRRHRAQKR
jgi:putative ABC transport system substrate-binding protein